PGEISVLLGPPGAGKSTFLKSLVGLLRPERGHVYVRDMDLARCSGRRLREARTLFGVLFQGGGLFGSMSVYDNIAIPLREHTSKGEAEIRRIVAEKMEMVGLQGAEGRLPGGLRRAAQAGRAGQGAGPRSGDRAARRPGRRARPGPCRPPQPADRRPERP